MGFKHNVKKLFGKKQRKPATGQWVRCTTTTEKTNGDGGSGQGPGMRELWLTQGRVHFTNCGEQDISLEGMLITPGETIRLVIQPGTAYQTGVDTSTTIKSSIYQYETIGIDASISVHNVVKVLGSFNRVELIQMEMAMQQRFKQLSGRGK